MHLHTASRFSKLVPMLMGSALIWPACSGIDGQRGDEHDSVESSSAALTAGATIAYEVESLTRSASAIGSKVTVEPKASGGNYVEFNGSASANAWIEFTLTNIAAGPYDLKFIYKSNTNRGIVQASIDGVAQGSTCNEYAATVSYQVPCSLGSKTLTAGNHKIRFTVTSKSSSSSGYQMVIDQISLTFKGACTVDANCVSSSYCSGGSCLAKKSAGAACAAAHECVTSFCTNGLCSTSACTVDTDCASSSYCSGGSCLAKKTTGAACTAAHECVTSFCTNGLCSTSACTVDTNCASGSYCSGGSCFAKKPTGAACTAAHECVTSFCTNGLCSTS